MWKKREVRGGEGLLGAGSLLIDAEAGAVRQDEAAIVERHMRWNAFAFDGQRRANLGVLEQRRRHQRRFCRVRRNVSDQLQSDWI